MWLRGRGLPRGAPAAPRPLDPYQTSRSTPMTSTPTFYPAPGGMPFSSAVRAGGFLMLSGQIPLDDARRPHTGSIEEQTHVVLKSIAATLQGLGSSLDEVVKVSVWLSDLAH